MAAQALSSDLQVCPMSTDKVVSKIIKFVSVLCDVEFYAYQETFAWRIVESVVSGDGNTITGLWARQSGKCLARDTEVMMFDGSIKRVQNVRVGDLLMGDDSTPRKVLELARGTEEMVEVIPLSGGHESYTVNKSHILSVKRKTQGSSAISPRWRGWVTEDVSAKKLLKQNLENNVQGYKVPVEFPRKKVPIDPYWFGAWLGDGHSVSTRITTADAEIVMMIEQYAAKLGMRVGVYAEAEGNAATSYAIVKQVPSTSGRFNPLFQALCDLDVLDNKHIPQVYKSNDRKTRLAVLAGLIDTDGHKPVGSGKENVCEFVFRSKRLARDVQWLARSLGFRASIRSRVISTSGSDVVYWRVFLYGALWSVPTVLPRKQWEESSLRENPLQYGFRLEEVGEDKYYGFVIDGNKRFLLGDCTVTHNTECIADVTLGMCIILPALSDAFPDDERFMPFAKGFAAGIYAPIDWQANISFARMRNVLATDQAKEVLEDEEIGVAITTNRAALFAFSNGSRVLAKSASPETQLEGDTHNLIILEECQKITRAKVDKEIEPMRAATGGTMVKIGTAWHSRGGFHLSIQDNVEQFERYGRRNHFEFDYQIVIAEKRRAYETEKEQGKTANPFHLKYELYVNDQIRQHGIDSDEFQMNFGCKWKETRIIAIRATVLLSARRLDLERGRSRMGFQVAGLDIGGMNDATVLSTLFVDREHPVINRSHVPEADEDRQIFYPKVLMDWKEFMGDFEGDDGQYNLLYEYLMKTSVQILCIDATSIGNPVYQRMVAMLEPEIICYPFVFSAPSKHNLYKYYLQELNSGRFHYAAGKQTQQDREYQKFIREHESLDKVLRGQYVVYEASEGEHDDYPDSAALACWAERLMEELIMPEMVAIGPGASSPFTGGDVGALASNPWRRRRR